jgi:hypothetical protein
MCPQTLGAAPQPFTSTVLIMAALSRLLVSPKGEACNRNRKMKLPMEKECWFFFSLLSPKRNLPYLLAYPFNELFTHYYTNSKMRVQLKMVSDGNY